MHLRHEVPVKVKVQVGLLVADDLAKVRQADFICVFVFTIVLGMLLNCVVCQMNKGIGDVV